MVILNKCEAEVDAIRDKIIEEIKYMSREEQAKRLREKTRELATEFGFQIVASSKQVHSNT